MPQLLMKVLAEMGLKLQQSHREVWCWVQDGLARTHLTRFYLVSSTHRVKV